MEICPIGFFCFDKNTFLIILIGLIIIIIYYINKNNTQFYLEKLHLENKKDELKNELLKEKQKINNKVEVETNHNVPQYLVTKDYEREVNPLLPPERSPPNGLNKVGIPINIPSRGYSSDYQRVGALIGNGNDKNKQILPLFGMQTYPGSRQWQYYTTTDTYNSVKLEVFNKGKNCQNDYGCCEIYDGDNVTINGYDGNFKANLYNYDKPMPRYIPFIY